MFYREVKYYYQILRVCDDCNIIHGDKLGTTALSVQEVFQNIYSSLDFANVSNIYNGANPRFKHTLLLRCLHLDSNPDFKCCMCFISRCWEKASYTTGKRNSSQVILNKLPTDVRCVIRQQCDGGVFLCLTHAHGLGEIIIWITCPQAAVT